MLDEEEFRRSEYQAICDGKVGPQSELYVEKADLAAYGADCARFFSKIRLVHKLRDLLSDDFDRRLVRNLADDDAGLAAPAG